MIARLLWPFRAALTALLIGAVWSGQLLLQMMPAGLPLAGVTTDVDGRVLLFTFVVAAATALLFGCAPAWQTTRADVAPVLKDAVAARHGGVLSTRNGPGMSTLANALLWPPRFLMSNYCLRRPLHASPTVHALHPVR